MDFSFGPEVEKFRQEVREFAKEHVTPEVLERAWKTGTMHDWGLHKALAERRWIEPSWPHEMGGQGRSSLEVMVMEEEFSRAMAPIDGHHTTGVILNTLRRVGTPEQQAEIIPRALAGEILICLGYSEPDSGSDVAAAKTTAVRDGDDWVINGQKMFTTMAHEAEYVFLLTRTDTDAPKHRGLTMFLVPMKSPGVEVQPVWTLGGQRTNMTFYDNVRVSDKQRVGEVNRGWDVIVVGLTYERRGVSELGPFIERLTDWARSVETEKSPGFELTPAFRRALAKAQTRAEVARLLDYRVAWSIEQGLLPAVEGSMGKLFGPLALYKSTSELLDTFGPLGLLQEGEPYSVARGELEHMYRYSTFKQLEGGTNEIQRSIIAERALGLPRSR